MYVGGDHQQDGSISLCSCHNDWIFLSSTKQNYCSPRTSNLEQRNNIPDPTPLCL